MFWLKEEIWKESLGFNKTFLLIFPSNSFLYLKKDTLEQRHFSQYQVVKTDFGLEWCFCTDTWSFFFPFQCRLDTREFLFYYSWNKRCPWKEFILSVESTSKLEYLRFDSDTVEFDYKSQKHLKVKFTRLWLHRTKRQCLKASTSYLSINVQKWLR